MTKDELANVRPGDEVTVRMVVISSDRRGLVGVRCLDATDTMRLSYPRAEHFVSHATRALDIGDTVWGRTTKANGTVRATYHGMIWVEFEDGRHEVVVPDQVERAL